MPLSPTEIEEALGHPLFVYQKAYLDALQEVPHPARTCLYYKTGAGKSITALAGLALLGYEDCIVVTPPSTHMQWQVLARALNIKTLCISHAKFRARAMRFGKGVPIIADEFHLFGGQQGLGWRKLDRLARGLQAPLVLLSATPNYNDAERVYCVQHVLDPASAKGGYIQFLYENCLTEQDRFSMTPKVLGFKDHPDAAAYLAALPGVFYVPDDLVYVIEDIPVHAPLPEEMLTHSYDRRKHRMIASRMEQRHKMQTYGLTKPGSFMREEVLVEVRKVLARPGKVLVYANHATVAESMSHTLRKEGVTHALVTGSTSRKDKDDLLHAFIEGGLQVLVGSASIATGTDGMDKVCDTLLILDDTDDDSLRRQLIGRIMPRGASVQSGEKKVFRIVLNTN